MEQRRLSLSLTAAILGISATSRAQAPIDATCAWGRLSDGHGALVRCLTEEEAARLREAPPSHPSAEPPKLMAVVPAEPQKEAPAPASDATQPAADAPRFTVEVGKVTADEGSLPDSRKNLVRARERFLGCAKAGGVAPDGGEVELRFLVLGRGRAEGVSVQKRHGVSVSTARCLADVLDRRFVGYPDGPQVAATLVVTMKKK